jgi:hypothetical protein
MKHQINLTRNLGRVLDQYVEARTTSIPLQAWFQVAFPKEVAHAALPRSSRDEARPDAIFYTAQNYRTPQTTASDGEITADFLIVAHMRLLGGLAHLFDRDRIEIGEKGFARLAHGRIDNALKERRVCAEIVRIGGAQRHRGAHDLPHSDAPAFARYLIAAARAAHALKDVRVDQALEQCLQVTRRQFVTRSQNFGGYRLRLRNSQRLTMSSRMPGPP